MTPTDTIKPKNQSNSSLSDNHGLQLFSFQQEVQHDSSDQKLTKKLQRQRIFSPEKLESEENGFSFENKLLPDESEDESIFFEANILGEVSREL